MKAIVLLSGGLDSTVAMYKAKNDGFDELYALSFDYGQRHACELACAKTSAEKIGVVAHNVVNLKLDLWGGSSLTDKSMKVEEGNMDAEEIPNTYVPARNMVFLSVAASFAEAVGARDIYIGVSEVDYSGYVDCREEFIKSMENTINQGTVCAVEKGEKIKIHAPFIHKTKAQEIKLGWELGVDFDDTWSCYNGGDAPCGVCDSCLLRDKAFEEAALL